MKDVKIESSDLNGMKLYELTGPDYWSYEGVEPHYYVIEKDGKFHAFWEDKYVYDMIACLMDSSLLDTVYGGFPTAGSLEVLIEKIDSCYQEGGE